MKKNSILALGAKKVIGLFLPDTPDHGSRLKVEKCDY
jgi:hypothetical protein